MKAFVDTPEGIGGASAFLIEPRWVLDERFVAVEAASSDPGRTSNFFVLAVPPALEEAFAELDGRWVGITGRFNDPVAQTCVVTHGDPPDAPPADTAIDLCRTVFLLTSVEPAPNAPGTDAEPFPTATDSRSTDVAMLLMFVSLMTFAAAAAHLARRAN